MNKARGDANVVVISQLPPPVHGSTLMTKVFLRTLDSAGISTSLVDRRFSYSVDAVGRFSPRKVLAAIGLASRLVRELVVRRPAVIVFFATSRSFSFVVDWILSEMLRAYRKPVVLYLHATGFADLSRKGKVWSCLVQRLLGSADTIVTLSPSLDSDVEGLSAARLVSIPNTLPEVPVPLPEIQQIADRRTVLFLSNLIPGKGHEDFLSVAVASLESGLDCDFRLAGHADPETIADVQKKIETSGQETRIQYVGPVSGQQKWKLLHSARALVFPSHKEALPLVLIEALACGVPIVSYRVGALADTLESAGAAEIVEVGDRTSLAQSLARVVTSDDIASQMHDSCLSLYDEEYGLKAFKARWEGLLWPLISTCDLGNSSKIVNRGDRGMPSGRL